MKAGGRSGRIGAGEEISHSPPAAQGEPDQPAVLRPVMDHVTPLAQCAAEEVEHIVWQIRRRYCTDAFLVIHDQLCLC